MVRSALGALPADLHSLTVFANLPILSSRTDEPFTEEFKEGVKQMTRSECRFGLIDQDQWGYPSWIDQEKAAKARQMMEVSE